MKIYRFKKGDIEAIQFNGDNHIEIMDSFKRKDVSFQINHLNEFLCIYNENTNYNLVKSDWLCIRDGLIRHFTNKEFVESFELDK